MFLTWQRVPSASDERELAYLSAAGAHRLEASETREDQASAEEALAEYRRDGGEAADAFFGKLAAETWSAYGSDKA